MRFVPQEHAASTIMRVTLSTSAAPLSFCIYSLGGKMRVKLQAVREEKSGITEVQGEAGPRHLWLVVSDG